MTIGTGRVEAADINREFGRYYRSYMSIWDARNGNYGRVNTRADRNPRGVGQTNSGYAYSDWRGYNHNAGWAQIWLNQREQDADVDTRVISYHWQGSYITQRWQWGTTNLRWIGNEPYGRRYNVLFDNGISWGNPSAPSTRRIYSNQRGYLLNVRERVSTFRFYDYFTTRSNENIYITNTCP
tara:strand:- start:1220 stop:1765 length:546 start_codon:yes stop_codon:yes gene_type:complete